ncbi:MAG: tRNA lysidine(34) synthetase TilS [Negativicutes bacterium]|nr:tRNA lysidine(34) synthetase TilS [Negativicutes bacterium]
MAGESAVSVDWDSQARRFIAPLRNFVRHRQLIEEGDSVLLACSGGSDSLSLLYMLAYLQPQLGFRLAAVHVDHGLRPESADDGRAVAEICQQLSVPCQVVRADTAAVVAEGYGGQEAARLARYRALWQVAGAGGHDKTAVGHQLDDRVETLLINLLRGTGSNGWSAMGSRLLLSGREIAGFLRQPRSDVDGKCWQIVRPLLNYRRSQLEEFCRRHRLPVREDSTNHQYSYLRNRIRGQLMPLLEQIRPGAAGNLARVAEWLAGESEVLEKIAGEFWQLNAVTGLDGGWRLPRPEFGRLDLAVRRRVAMLGWRQLYFSLTGCQAVYIEELCRLGATAAGSKTLVWPEGRMVTVDRRWISGRQLAGFANHGG